MTDHRPPNVFSLILSSAEQDQADHLTLLISLVDSYVAHFRSAHLLFEYARNEIRRGISGRDLEAIDRVSGWPFIAARDSAMTIYHVGSVLRAIRDQVHKCPTLRQFFDSGTMRLALQLYQAQFARAERMRHAVGHSADNLTTPADLHRTREGKNRRGPSGALRIENIHNRLFETTYDGEVLSFEISEVTLKKLVRIRDLVFDALMPIERALSELQGPFRR